MPFNVPIGTGLFPCMATITCRPFVCLAFSKKLDNFKAAIALNIAYYNLVKKHSSLRCTPAMAAGVERSAWTVSDLIDAA